jgi:hypothetical protein
LPVVPAGAIMRRNRRVPQAGIFTLKGRGQDMETQASATPSQPFNLQTRVVNILTKPQQEWPTIAAEPRDIAGLYSKYIVLLAAISPICMAIGYSVIGFGFGIRYSFAGALTLAVLQYVLTLVGVYVSGVVVAKLAPTFQSEPDTAQAVKLVAYAWTPAWVAGVLNLIPALGILVVLASLYSLYLLYLGVTPVMKTPADKVIPYLVVSAIVLIVVYFVIGAIASAIVMTMGMGLGAIARPTF